MNHTRVIFYNPSELQAHRHMVRRWTQFVRRKNQHRFLQMCLQEHILPKTFGMICEKSFSGEEFPEYQRRFLQDRIQGAKWEVEKSHLDLRQQINFARDCLQSNVFEGAKRVAGEVACRRGLVHMANLRNKLNNLCDKSPWSEIGRNCSILNLSTYNINKNQKEILGLGLNFCLGTDKDFIINGISNVNYFNFRHEEYQVNFLKGIIVNNGFNHNINVLPLRHQKALESLSKNKEIKIMRADKGGSIVIMSFDDYLLKAYTLLGDGAVYTKLPVLPPVTEVQMNFNRRVKKIANSIQDETQRQLILSKISSKTPSLPYFYGIPKAHKAGCPLRPIVATCNSPQSALAEWLAGELSPLLGFFSGAHLLHSSDFVDRIRRLGNVSGRMLSLDVTALFTNVPLEYVLSKLKEKYEQGMVNFSLPIEKFLELIRLCVSSTVFSFNGEGYKQTFGVAMGSPLSPILANLCMEFIENDILDNCPPQIKPVIWLRYVDDIFLIFKESEEHFNEFFRYVNNIVPSIQFTVEHEINHALPFLDVLVMHDPITQKFKFTVYRKPTNKENYIHFYSFHSSEVKSNIIVNFIVRAYRICDPEFLDEEIDHIRCTFSKLCYPTFFIEKAISRAKKKIFCPTANHEEKKNFLSLPYHPNLITVQKKMNMISNGKANIVFNYNNTLRKKLIHNKTDTEIKTDIGVYKIPCKGCSSNYFGETGRGLEVRLKEHQRAYKDMADNSALVKHSWKNDHQINWNGASILYKNKNVGNRRLVEGAFINIGDSMEGNKAFTQEDNFINTLICSMVVSETKNNINSHSNANPDTASSFSPAQVTGLRQPPFVAGTYADVGGSPERQQFEHRLRRSRRIAGLPSEDGIT